MRGIFLTHKELLMTDKRRIKEFWPILLYPAFLNYFLFYPTHLYNCDISNNKNSKAYSSGWLKPVLFHKLSGSFYHVFKGDLKDKC